MAVERLECGIIRDLLPLYLDEVCSPESCRAVDRAVCGRLRGRRLRGRRMRAREGTRTLTPSGTGT